MCGDEWIAVDDSVRRARPLIERCIEHGGRLIERRGGEQRLPSFEARL